VGGPEVVMSLDLRGILKDLFEAEGAFYYFVPLWKKFTPFRF